MMVLFLPIYPVGGPTDGCPNHEGVYGMQCLTLEADQLPQPLQAVWDLVMSTWGWSR